MFLDEGLDFGFTGGAGEEVGEVVVAEVDWFFFFGFWGRGVCGGRDWGVEGGFAIVDSGVLLADRGEGGCDFLVECDGC